MARKPKGASPKAIKTTAKDLQAAMRDAAGAKQRASNAQANKSSALQDYAQKSGFSGAALNFGLKLHSMEDIKRTDLVREILMIHQMMGWGEQADLFDDIGAQIAEAAKRAEEAEKARQGKPKGEPGLPLEALEKGIKPLDTTKAARRKRKDSSFDGPPGEAMRAGAAESEAFLKGQIAKGSKGDTARKEAAAAIDEMAGA